ncbi:helix-turn-helix domain-containing protein [Acidaminococcus sp. LBK-2]|uniref:helix-turn-helix domain-containing protein n=1 Tax=Acidaminococcus sp. LBK-2 TaxID=3456956 RepID=UPI003FA4738F
MAFTFKPLWKLLIDKDMTKKELMRETGISKSTMDKMGRGDNVSLDIIDRICNHFDCKVEDVLEHYRSENEVNKE